MERGEQVSHVNGDDSNSAIYDASAATQAVRLLSAAVALAVVAVAGITGANHSAEMVRALLLTGGASAHVIICIETNNGNIVTICSDFEERMDYRHSRSNMCRETQFVAREKQNKL